MRKIEQDIQRSKGSSRQNGAVGKDPVVYQVAREMLMPHHTVLDFGSGKHALHTTSLRAAGHNVTAHDYHATPGVHDPEALKRRYHVVLASNVLNIQNSPRQLASTLNDIANSVHPADGMAIVNMPTGPLYDAWKGMDVSTATQKLEVALKRRFKSVNRYPNSPSGTVWILKSPRYQHSP